VLPRERNPNNLAEAFTTLLRGESYGKDGGYWQQLELRRPVKLLKEEQQRLRAQFQRDVDVAQAYVDRVVLNVCGGPGLTEVWVDDLSIGPVVEVKDSAKPAAGTAAAPVSRSLPSAATPRVVRKGGSVASGCHREAVRVRVAL